ncbi:TolC family protein [Ahrensia sp. 13_GOM-1096m]|uniref:TolC family protein n=1 Tax=Ahrensia sp. 13_GOM-1096m TaxID=1380380 RepID=UPI00047B0892|nr:TolC family protein [Ahrensia sp. 13_GOM-1096m]
MTRTKLIRIATILTPLVLAGCMSTDDGGIYGEKNAVFAKVASSTLVATGKQSVWVQNQEQATALSKRAHTMVHKKTISADTAVQVALLNNKGLQAAYADIGMSAAEVWQQSLPENPVMSVGILGIAAPDLGLFRAVEGMIATNILSSMTRKRRVDLADTKFRQAQYKAAVETLRVAVETRRAWITAVSSFETIYYLNQGKAAADAASELAQKLGQSGALPKAGQAREHAFYAELTGQTAEAKLAAQLAKEELTRIMGLWGTEVDYFVPDKQPKLPRTIQTKNAVESEALQKRVDLQVAKLQLEASAKAYGLTESTRYLTDLEIISGAEVEREREEDGVETSISPQVEFEFVIPIFDSGKARLRKAELAYMRDANLLAEKAINIRSEARSAYKGYRSSYDIARHYKNSVLPLRTKIEAESLLTYNGMITNTFELLADTRAKIGTLLQSVNAKRDFWLADANLNAAIYGGGASAGGGGSAVTLADAGGGH